MITPEVILKPLQHRYKLRIALQFKINKKIQDAIKKIEGAAWSQTHKCWHIPHSVKNYILLTKLLQPLAVLDISLLKAYQEKQLLTKVNKTPVTQKGNNANCITL